MGSLDNAKTWLPQPEDASALKKGAITERQRQRLIDGLKPIAEGLRSFAKAHELIDGLAPKEIHDLVQQKGVLELEGTRENHDLEWQLYEQSKLYRLLAVTEAEAGLYAQAKKTSEKIVESSSNNTTVHIYKAGVSNHPNSDYIRAKHNIASCMARAGYGRESLDLIRGYVQNTARKSSGDSKYLLEDLHEVERALQQNNEPTAEVRGIMKDVILHCEYQSDQAQWLLEYNFLSDLRQYLSKHSELDKTDFLLEIYLREKSSKALNDLVQAINDLRKPPSSIVETLAHHGDTKAITTIANHVLYGNGWIRWLTGWAEESSIDFTKAHMVAYATNGKWSLVNDLLSTQPAEQQSALQKKFTEIEIEKGNLAHALELLNPMEYRRVPGYNVNYIPYQHFHDQWVRSCISKIVQKAVEQSQFDLALKQAGRLYFEERSVLLESIAIAKGRRGQPIDDIVEDIKTTKEEDPGKKENYYRTCSRIYLAVEDLIKAEEAIKQGSAGDFMRNRSDWPELNDQLAVAHIAHGDIVKATQLSTTFQNKPSSLFLEAMIEYYADHNEPTKITTFIDALSRHEDKVRAWAKVGKILFDKGLPIDEIREMTTNQANAVVLSGETEAIQALRALRPDLLRSLESADVIGK